MIKRPVLPLMLLTLASDVYKRQADGLFGIGKGHFMVPVGHTVFQYCIGAVSYTHLWIVLLSVYGVDSVLTIIHRLMLHENLGLPHRKHLYQIMANDLKIPHIMVSSIYMAVQAIIIVGYIMCLG